ncbi:Vesicle transport through interaction with t-SNAREs 1A, partial [Charadrius vociferus]
VSDEKKQMVANVEKQLEEARELLEQMELEVREIPAQSRGMYSSRMRSYKQEMGKLEADFKRSRIAYSDEVRNELLGDDGNSSENQRAHLLDNTERLERSSRRLEAGYQIAVET